MTEETGAVANRSDVTRADETRKDTEVLESPKARPAESEVRAPRWLGWTSATALVAASMIGTGIFTVSGEVLAQTQTTGGGLLLAWMLGGIYALCGALCYAELATALPESGGEALYLSRIYHPLFGFLAGWVSLIAGFSAPIALSAIAFGLYLQTIVPATSPEVAAIGLVILLSCLHGFDVRHGARVQNGFAGLKVLLIVVFIVGGAIWGKGDGSLELGSLSELGDDLLTENFALALIQIVFAYSGWNAASYVAGEVRSPAKTLPRALLGGTLLVTVLYVGLNVVFLLALSPAEMSGVVSVGDLAARAFFGEGAGRLLTIGITLALVSSVSAFIMSGPRVYREMGRHAELFRLLRPLNRRGAPTRAVALQAIVAVAMILVSDFRELLFLIGFTLSLSAALAVLGLIVLRWTRPDLERPYRTTAYPIPPLLFLAFTAWMIVDGVAGNLPGVLRAVAVLAAGVVVFYLGGRRARGASEVE